MSADLAPLAQDPFDQLLRIEQRLRSAQDAAGDRSASWTGLGFRLRGRWLVAPAADVGEVVPVPGATRVPNARPWLHGIANVRGGLLTLIDLGQLLEQGPTLLQRSSRVLVLNSERLPLGFIVDEVAGYREFHAGEQRREHVAAAPELSSTVLGVFERDGILWFACSLHRLAVSDAMKQAGW